MERPRKQLFFVLQKPQFRRLHNIIFKIENMSLSPFRAVDLYH